MNDWVTISVVRTAGSVPRGAGTTMQVWADRTVGTIGGGALEWEATRIARTMLQSVGAPLERSFPLGPGLGQCCGGSVTLRFGHGEAVTPPERAPLWIYGAGHVGRALVNVLTPLDVWNITVVDTGPARFDGMAETVTPLIAADPAQAVRHAPGAAEHLIMTYSHDFDLAICHAILGRTFMGAGLIGSATKWARFRTRLAALGHAPAQISRIACPIGMPELGKSPQAIAIGVASAMLAQRITRQTKESA